MTITPPPSDPVLSLQATVTAKHNAIAAITRPVFMHPFLSNTEHQPIDRRPTSMPPDDTEASQTDLVPLAGSGFGVIPELAQRSWSADDASNLRQPTRERIRLGAGSV